jgi:hypothetical protein
VEALREVTAVVHKVIGAARRTAQVLAERWWTIAVDGTPVAPPGDTIAEPLSALEWPARDEIALTLSRWHTARARVDAAWELLPEDVRPLITQMPPPLPIRS